jgi:hypothetical protein
MITKQETFKDTVVGADSEESFSIDTESDVIFDILRNKMYKDKIGAVCREVASNSRDANRECDSDKPVEIEIISPNKILSMGHLSISFKDYGTGIPPNKMSDIFLKYGVSDKRSTNKLTGGFGLGSKSPFAYNDTFTVITVADFAEPVYKEEGTVQRVDPVTDVVRLYPRQVVDYYKPSERRKYKYTAMLDSSGKGKMVLFSNEIFEGETGTQIIVPINSDNDRYKFEKDSLKYTKTWGDEVVYKNFLYSADVLETAYEDDDVAIYKSQYYQPTTMQLLIDGIPYPLDMDIVKIKDTVGRTNNKYLTVLKFETGELTISANRESVQYDDDTTELIQNKAETLKTKLAGLTKTHIEEQETYLDACVISYYVNKASYNMINAPALTGAIIAHSKSVGYKFKNLTWRGIPTVDRFYFKHHTAYHVTLKNGQNKYEPVRNFQLNEVNSKSAIYYADARKNSSRNVNLWNNGEESFYLIKPNNAKSKEGIEEFMDFIFNFDIDFNLYSDLKVIKNASGGIGVYKKKSYVTLNVRTTFNDKHIVEMNRKTFETMDGEDFSKTVYSSVYSLSDYPEGKSELRFLEERGYEAIVIREQDYGNWFSNTAITHYKEVYEQEKAAFDKKVLAEQTDKVKELLLYQAVRNTINFDYIEELRYLLPQSAQGVQKVSHIDSDIVEVVKKELKFNYDGLRNKIKSIFEEQYPIAGLIMDSYKYKLDKSKKLLADYLKTI